MIFSFFALISNVSADEIDDINKEISNLQKELDGSLKATKPLEEDVKRMKTQISTIQLRISGVEKSIKTKESLISTSTDVAVDKKDLLDSHVLLHYKNINKQEGALLDLILAPNFYQALREVMLQKSVTEKNKQSILEIFTFMTQTEEQKNLLENEKRRLSDTTSYLDNQSKKLEGVIGEAKEYQKSISNKIASLSAKQQQLLAAKLGSLNLPTSLGAGPLFCTDDRKLDPGFGEGFAAFTFGIPHRVGMNQYGALGRAKSGQDYKTILNTYFNNIRLECRSSPSKKINVKGFGEVEVEQYLKGIYEMPASWPLEALKAQVIAARSYAMSYTGWGSKEICTTQACQVYKGGSKGGDWEKAVNETGSASCSDGQGLVMISNDTNDVVTGWFASTSGGYTFMSADVGWSNKPWTKRVRDTEGEIGSFDDLFARAFDRESPCFYAAQGARKEFGKSAWLKPEELADIVNVLMLAKSDTSTQNHLSQLDKPNPDGTDTWDVERVKSELRSRGQTPFNRISSANVAVDFGVGRVTSVTFSGDGGTHSFDGQEFRTFFNLRAPASIQIVGPLYRFERR